MFTFNVRGGLAILRRCGRQVSCGSTRGHHLAAPPTIRQRLITVFNPDMLLLSEADRLGGLLVEADVCAAEPADLNVDFFRIWVVLLFFLDGLIALWLEFVGSTAWLLGLILIHKVIELLLPVGRLLLHSRVEARLRRRHDPVRPGDLLVDLIDLRKVVPTLRIVAQVLLRPGLEDWGVRLRHS